MTLKKTPDSKANGSSKKAVIVGCGNYGKNLAIKLAESGKQVVIIDKNRVALEALSELSVNSDLIVGFLGDATLSDDLKEIEILNTDLFVATTNSDSINALAAQKAKLLFGVNNVICLISDVSKQKLYEQLGIRIVNYSEIIIESLIHSSLEN